MSPKGTVSLPWHDPPGLPSANSVPLFSFSTTCDHASYTRCPTRLTFSTGAFWSHALGPSSPPTQPGALLLVPHDSAPGSPLLGSPSSLLASGSQPRLCPARAPARPLMVLISWPTTFIFTSVFDKVGSFLGTGTRSLS